MKSKMMNKGLILILFIFLAACKNTDNEYVNPTNYGNDPVGNFDALWNGIEQNYVFFEYQKLNWQNIYQKHRSKLNENSSERDFRKVCFELMDELIDGHREIIVDNQPIYNGYIGWVNKHSYLNTDNVVEKNYLDLSTNLVLDVNGQSEFRTALIKDKPIAYIRCYAFLSSLQTNLGQKIIDSILTKVESQNYFKGIILDLRNNSGGEATAFYNFVGRFLQKNTYHWGYTSFRQGRNTWDMAPLYEEKINFSGAITYKKPLIILTNRWSFSAAELTSIALKDLPNVVIVGDTTGGATGPISSSRDFTGNFTLPNYWQVQLAQKITFDLTKTCFEGKGLNPDIPLKQNSDQLNQGVDNVLEMAIEKLLIF